MEILNGLFEEMNPGRTRGCLQYKNKVRSGGITEKDSTTLHTNDIGLATTTDGERFTSRILIDTCLGGPEQVSISSRDK